MPVYTYHCQNCDHEFDKRQSFEEQALKICPQCRKRALQKVYKPAAVAFKGSGFYINDKKKTAARPTGKPKEAATKEAASPAAEGKPSTESPVPKKEKAADKTAKKTD